LKTIFGNDAYRAAAILMKEGAGGVRDWTAAVNDQGYAAEQARIKLDNLTGDVGALGSAIDKALIEQGSFANDVLRDLAQGATGLVNLYGKAPAPIHATATAVLTAAAAAGTLGGAALLLVPRITETVDGLKRMGATAAGTRTALVGAAKATSVLAAAMVAAEGIDFIAGAAVAEVDINKLADAMARAGSSGEIGAEGLRLFSNDMAWFGRGDVHSTAEALDKFAESARTALDEGWGARFDRVESLGGVTTQWKEQVGQLDAAFAAMVRDGNVEEAAAWQERFAKAAVDAGAPVDKLNAAFPQYQAAIAAARDETAQTTSAIDKVAQAADDAGREFQSVNDALEDTIDNLQLLRGYSLDATESSIEVTESQIALRKALKDSNGSLDDQTEKGRAALQALVDHLRTVEQDAKNQGLLAGSTDATTKAFDRQVAGLRRMLRQMGVGKEQADRLLRSLVNLDEDFRTLVYADTDQAESAVRRLKGYIETINGQTFYFDVVGRGRVFEGSGGMLEFYAAGGMRERHVAQIAPAGVTRVWNEPETGGEAYIPLAASKRARGKGIVEAVAERFGGDVEWYAAGGYHPTAALADPGSLIDAATRTGKDGKRHFDYEKYQRLLRRTVADTEQWHKQLERVSRRSGADVAAVLEQMGASGVDVVRRMSRASSEEAERMARRLRRLSTTDDDYRAGERAERREARAEAREKAGERAEEQRERRLQRRIFTIADALRDDAAAGVGGLAALRPIDQLGHQRFSVVPPQLEPPVNIRELLDAARRRGPLAEFKVYAPNDTAAVIARESIKAWDQVAALHGLG